MTRRYPAFIYCCTPLCVNEISPLPCSTSHGKSGHTTLGRERLLPLNPNIGLQRINYCQIGFLSILSALGQVCTKPFGFPTSPHRVEVASSRSWSCGRHRLTSNVPYWSRQVL